MKLSPLSLFSLVISLVFFSRLGLGLEISTLEVISAVLPSTEMNASEIIHPLSEGTDNLEEPVSPKGPYILNAQAQEWRSSFREDTPWRVIYNAFMTKWGEGLGEWEKALMGAIWRAEGASFGIAGRDLQDQAINTAATIRNSIDRFWNYLPKLNPNSSRFDPAEAGKFGRALIATIAIEYFRLGEDVASLFGIDLLGGPQGLVPNYLSLLQEGREEIVTSLPARQAYVEELMRFIPESWNEIISGEEPLPAGIDDPYIMVADSFYQTFMNSSDEEQFLIFSTFIFPYVGSGFGSGYAPLWDMRGREWIGAYESSPGGFVLNSNWGMNVFSVLSYYFDFEPQLPYPLNVESYFIAQRP